MSLIEIKRYGFLLKELIQRDISSRYRGSIMGGLWVFIAPLIMLAVYTFVFGVVFQARWGTQVDSTGAFAINLFVGLILHGLLAESLSRSPSVLAQHTSYVKKIIFPVWLLPVVPVLSGVFNMLIGTVVLLVVAFFMVDLHWTGLLLPIVFVPLILFALGSAWLLAGLGVYLRDISQIIPVLITILMFMAPIFYPATVIPEEFRSWLLVNPLTYAVETARNLLFVGTLPSALGYVAYFVLASGWAVLGLSFFNRVKKGFADVL